MNAEISGPASAKTVRSSQAAGTKHIHDIETVNHTREKTERCLIKQIIPPVIINSENAMNIGQPRRKLIIIAPGNLRCL